MFEYPFPMASHTVDAVIYRIHREPLGLPDVQIALVERLHEPFKGSWAIVGGFFDVDRDDSLEAAARREVNEEVGTKDLKNLTQFRTYSARDRDPRGRVISTVFTAAVDSDTELVAGDDAKNVKWFYHQTLPKLAFDHAQILEDIFKSRIWGSAELWNGVRI